jgi:hypothetical protein
MDLILLWRNSPTLARAASLLRLQDHTQLHIIVGMTALDEGSARRRHLYLTTHNTHNRQISMLPGGIRTRYPSKQTAADPHFKPLGHWDRQQMDLHKIYL